MAVLVMIAVVLIDEHNYRKVFVKSPPQQDRKEFLIKDLEQNDLVESNECGIKCSNVLKKLPAASNINLVEDVTF